MDQGAQELQDAARQSLGRIRRDRETAPEDLRPLLGYVEEHLFERRTNVKRLKEVSDAPDQLSRLQSFLGLSLHTYIEDRRLETACHLLDETRLKVVEIAALLGYSSVQVFSRAFSRWSGKRPTAFRGRDRSRSPARAAASTELGRLANRLESPMSREEVESIRAEEVWRALEARSPAAQRELMERLRLDEASLTNLLRRRCRGRSRQDPEHAVHLARLAIAATESLRGEKQQARQKALCWAELANACREAKDFDEASRAMAVAEAWNVGVSLPEAVRIDFLTLKATLLRDLGQSSEALATIDTALAAARLANDQGLYAETLIAKAAILSRTGDPAGIALLEEALALSREAAKKGG